MKTNFDINKLIQAGEITNELDYERALIADRKLHVLSKEEEKYGEIRKKLRGIIANYETDHWNENTELNDSKIKESDLAEHIAEQERSFIHKRKNLIKSALKSFNLNQQELGLLLNHSSKSYMSELMNGISPFSLKDLVVINRLLKIELVDLIPTTLSQKDRSQIKSSVTKLNKPKLKLSNKDFGLNIT